MSQGVVNVTVFCLRNLTLLNKGNVCLPKYSRSNSNITSDWLVILPSLPLVKLGGEFHEWHCACVPLRRSATVHCRRSRGARLRCPTPIPPKISREESSSRRSRIREVALTRLRFFSGLPRLPPGGICTLQLNKHYNN